MKFNPKKWASIIMKIRHSIISGIALLLAASPASSADELSVSELVVEPKLSVGKLYDVAFRYDGDASGATEVCFLWSGEGPFCWADFKVNKKAKLITTKAKTGNPNKYTLTGFVRYGSGKKTGRVSAPIDVR